MFSEEFEECIDCGKKLKPVEKIEGFCYNCQIKLKNDLRILNENVDEKSIFSENIFAE
jgi:hypothetical protein